MMNKRLLMKTAVGVGLIAGSIAASATINGVSFGSPQIFARAGAAPYYGLFLPSGNTSTDAVVLVEAVQGTSANTWSYVVGVESFAANANKWKTDRGAVYSVGSDTIGGAYSMAGFDPNVGIGGSVFSGTLIAPAALSGTQVITYPFGQVTAGTGASSVQNCSMTFEASINSAEALVFKMMEMRPVNWVPPQLTIVSGTFGLQTGTAAANSFAGTWSDYFGNAVKGILPVSTFSLGGNAYNSGAYSMLSFSGSYTFYASAGSLSSTVTATSFPMGSVGQNAGNMCMTARAARESLNNSGLIGGSQGLVKIW